MFYKGCFLLETSVRGILDSLKHFQDTQCSSIDLKCVLFLNNRKNLQTNSSKNISLAKNKLLD